MASEGALEKLSKHVKRQGTHSTVSSMSEEELSSYATKLTTSLAYLQRQLRKSSDKSPLERPPATQREQLHQVLQITSAYKSLVTAEPILPSAQSPVPALLALRNTLHLINESKSTIAATLTALTNARGSLRRESEMLKDVEQIAVSLKQRLESLQSEQERQTETGISGTVLGLTADEQHRKQRYAKDMRHLVRALNRFVAEQLAGMLAAEDLGGPVVGDSIEISEDNLTAGFTAQGKPKKIAGGEINAQRRVQRNVEIWGEEISIDSNGIPRSEKQCAALAFRALAESLLNAAAETDEDSSYVPIKKEDAAARFLIRTKAAKFASEDARKLCLRDLGE